MPLCSPALLLSAATLTVAVSTHLPTPTDLTTPTWCYATNGGRDVESWSLKPDGTARVILHFRNGARVNEVIDHATWKLRRDVLVVRVPRHKRFVLKIEEFAGRRLMFENENQAIPCQP